MDCNIKSLKFRRILILMLLFLCLCSCTFQCQGSKVSRYLTMESSLKKSHFSVGLKKIFISMALGLASGLAGAIMFVCVVRFVVLYMNRTPILKGAVIFSLKILPSTLQSALKDETQLLGSSACGKYYKILLDNGLTIAVKKLEPFEIGSPERQSKSVKRRMQKELEVLASLRYGNLMILRAYIRDPDRFFLVYDYIPSGSLEDAIAKIRQNQMELSWDLRLNIAVGIVKCLRYLHFECSPQILHYNLKPTNVILDADLQPKLTDFGLAMLLPISKRASSPYTAPECCQTFRYTEKSEIYSFGMILAVLLTGRDPSDAFFKEEANRGGLANWLRHLQLEGEAREALDCRLLIGDVGEDEMLMALRIAVVCLSELPADRPCSDELVSMLSQLHSY